MYALLRYVPKNHLSFCFGLVARIPLPRLLAGSVNRAFASRYGIDLSESEHPPEYYPTLGRFFTRNLRAGARSIGNGIVSPVDGALVELGEVDGETLIQAKGKTYTLSRLLGEKTLAQSFINGFYLTIYLAPGDYHHIHCPVDGAIEACYYIPGSLWPVNSWSVNSIDDLFSVNERIITVLTSNYGRVAVVKVGATNVGAVSVTYDGVRANGWRRVIGGAAPIEKRCYEPPIPCARGERLGTFHLGSTVILLFERGRFRPGERARAGTVRLGERLDFSGEAA